MIAALRDVTYRYPHAPVAALDEVSLDIDDGEFVVVRGPSAGGKSTFLRLFNGLVPQFHGGAISGTVRVAGLDPVHTPARVMATIAGMVFQEPEAQAIADSVTDEIVFGMEQQGIALNEMRQRFEAVLDELAIGHLRHRRVTTLSGGERQRVAIAAVLALQPRLLLLDEPTSQLDGDGAEAVISALRDVHRDGRTVLVAEHRLERLLPAATTVLHIEDGRVSANKAGGTLAIPPSPQHSALSTLTGSPLIDVRGLTVAYGELRALDDVALTVREGEVVALIGPNGSGKTTLFRAITGLVAPSAGEVLLAGKPAPKSVQERTAIAGLVPQDPAIALYRDTVRQEIEESVEARGVRRKRRGPRQSPISNRQSAIDSALSAWNLSALAGRHPRDISVGQQQRVAIGAMLAHEPRAWLLDEPTRGADEPAKTWLCDRLRGHAEQGGAAIVSTHDLGAARRFATRVVRLDAGRVVSDLPADRAWSE